jgi:hypothetical protein
MRRIMLSGLPVLFTLVTGGAFADNAPDPETFATQGDNQLGLTFSPDGSTAYWVAWNGDWGSSDGSPRRIYSSTLHGSAWSAPVAMAFSGQHSDDDPFVSPDGEWLYFVSDRPTSCDDEADANIWRFSLADDKHLELLSINSDAEEYSPVVTASGTLYFASDRDGGQGQGDLYRAAPSGDDFAAPEALGRAFNTPTGEWNLWVSADETDVLFEASSRPTNLSIPGDLYYSWRAGAEWSPAISVSQLNTIDSDLMPRLHPDGETLYYTSAPIGGHARTLTTNWKSLREQLRATACAALTAPGDAGTHRCSE